MARRRGHRGRGRRRIAAPRPGRPGMDVVHEAHGRGWVWGSGRGVVTVRFETAETGPGRVLSFAVDRPGAARRSDHPKSDLARPAAAGRTPRRSSATHHPDHRVAAGRRVVVEEDHRLPVGRHLDGAQHHPLARQLLLAAPADRLALEPQPDPVGRAAHDVRRPVERLHRRRRSNQSSRGPSRSRSSGRPAADAHRVDRHRRARRAARRAARRPRSTGAGPSPESRSVDREPSTGSTSMPPETAT